MFNKVLKVLIPCICLIIGFCTGVAYDKDKQDNKPPIPDCLNSISVLKSADALKATYKTKPTEPDLVVSQQVTAVVNGKKVGVPIDQKTNKTDTSVNNSYGTTTHFTQEINLTPLLKELSPKWEVGVGYMYVDNHSYLPISVQRNYKPDKAIELTAIYDLPEKSVEGVMIQHKWRFK